jgi:signal peptidase II
VFLSKKISSILILFLVLVDQLSKFWARDYLKPIIRTDFIPSFLEFKYAENTGMAFSFLASEPFILTILISIINLGLLFYFLKEAQPPLFLIFIFAGAFSNLLDRYLFGFVTDFINPTFMDFAIFNLADVSLNIGLAFYILDTIFSGTAAKDE